MKTELKFGKYENVIFNKAAEANEIGLITRIWEKDYTVWSNSPAEITNRLGWLDISNRMEKVVGSIKEFTESVKSDFTDAVLLGMGGSSLAPDVFGKVFGKKEGYPVLHVADSTHTNFIKNIDRKLDLSKTLFIVSTKSGGTAETISLMKYYYNRCSKELGGNPGDHFIAITDPGSGLETMANELNFRQIFLNDPNIGGRFSALSYFGMVPAAIIGVDVHQLLSRLNKSICKVQNPDCHEVNKNTAALTGIALGVLSMKNRNKLSFITTGELANFGDWVEQLIAESTGKNGKGILPVVGESGEYFDYYGNDRVVVLINSKHESADADKIQMLLNNNIPVFVQTIDDVYDIGELMYFWEFATATAGWVMEINPFDQPNVESAKIAAKELMAEFQETGNLPPLEYNYQTELMKVNSTLGSKNFDEEIVRLTEAITSKEFPYVSVQSYSAYSDELENVMSALRKKIALKFNVPTTFGYGPRFLHSTGQLHKGDDGSGLFIQLFEEPQEDIAIPDNPNGEGSSITFGVLVRAQSLGDRKALTDNKRDVVRFESKDIISVVKMLNDKF